MLHILLYYIGNKVIWNISPSFCFDITWPWGICWSSRLTVISQYLGNSCKMRKTKPTDSFWTRQSVQQCRAEVPMQSHRVSCITDSALLIWVLPFASDVREGGQNPTCLLWFATRCKNAQLPTFKHQDVPNCNLSFQLLVEDTAWSDLRLEIPTWQQWLEGQGHVLPGLRLHGREWETGTPTSCLTPASAFGATVMGQTLDGRGPGSMGPGLHRKDPRPVIPTLPTATGKGSVKEKLGCVLWPPPKKALTATARGEDRILRQCPPAQRQAGEDVWEARHSGKKNNNWDTDTWSKSRWGKIGRIDGSS